MQNRTPEIARKSLWLCGLCAIAIFAVGCGDTVSERNVEDVTINLPETRSLLQGKPGSALAIDTRPADEFAAAHIPGARNIDLASVSAAPDSIEPELSAYSTLVVYGANPGSGSARAMTKRLIRAGHKGVKYFGGGFAEWVASGMRTEGSGLPSPKPAPPLRGQ